MPRIKLPSPAMAISLLALFVALGGTGYAAATIGSSQIKNNSIRGKDVRNSTLTGKRRQAQLAHRLRHRRIPPGQGPQRHRADTAGNAAVANALTGAGASAYFPSRKVTATGVVKLPKVGTSPATSPARTLLAKGPFKRHRPVLRHRRQSDRPARAEQLRGRCRCSTTSRRRASTRTIRANAAFDGTVRHLTAQAPSGATLAAQVDFAVNGLGSPCAFALSAVTHP